MSQSFVTTSTKKNEVKIGLSAYIVRKIIVNVFYTLKKIFGISYMFFYWIKKKKIRPSTHTFFRISFLLCQKKNIEYDMPKICTKYRKHCCKYQVCFIIFQSIFTSQSICHIILDVLFLAQEEKNR